MKGMDAFTARAFDMVASGTVRNALDLNKEDKKTRERYKGVEQFLTARRLVEAGVGCVTLSIGGWDTHGNNFKTLARQLPQVDRGIANLIGDLHDRGMDKDVVTVMWGEFGRTPQYQQGRRPRSLVAGDVGPGGRRRSEDGPGHRRQHAPAANIPRTAAIPCRRCSARCTAPSASTRRRTFPNGSGRPMYILDDRSPVTELL